jgi:Carboxypeptidase regulatory-like domain/TonB dependent receptor
MQMRFKIFKTVSITIASAVLPALAQNSAEITGSASDSSGAMIAGVTVTMTNTATNQARKVTTNSAGAYDAPYLVPGIYDVTAEIAGFKVTARKGVELQVGDTARIDFVLQVGEVSEQVLVTGGAPLVNTENAEVGTVIDNKRIVELPLNGRNFLSLIALSPNVSVEASPSSVTTLQGGLRSTQGFNVAGMRYEFNRYTLDGVENTDPNFNSYVFQPSVDAVQEFKVQSGIYSAEFGRNVTQINATTKSGTNQFHGTLFDFLRNSDLDAAQWLQQGAKAPFRRNQFGGVLGGPLIRNKVFFLSNYEGLRDRLTSQTFSSQPTDRMFAGDMSGQPRQIFDPASRVYTTDASGNPRAVSATPFPGNIVPASRFDPLIVQKILPLMPRATIPGDAFLNNYVRQAARPLDTDEYTQRIDWNQSARSTWFGRFSWEADYQEDTAAFVTAVGHVSTSADQAVLTNIQMLGPSTVNEFRFGLNIFKNDRVGYYAGKKDIGATLGIGGLPPALDTLAWGLPTIGLANGISSGISSSDPFVLRDTTFQWMDNVSMVRGSHTLKFGGEIRRDRYNQIGQQFTFSNFSFAGQDTWNPANRNATGFSMADLLLGQVTSIQWAFGLANAHFRSTGYAAYFQDDWKVARNLTVNLGLRYENARPWSDKYCAIMNEQMFDPGVGPNGLLAPGQTKTPILTRPCSSGDFHQGMAFHYADDVPVQVGNQYMGHALVAPDNNDFSPRVGLAYSPTNRWTLRSGFGGFYARDIGNTVFDMGRNIGGRGQFASNTEIPNSPIEDPWGSLRGVASCSGWAGLCSVQPQIFTQPYNTRTPYVLEWLFNIQRQLTQNILLEVGYQGSESHKLQGQRYYNQAVPRTGTADASTPAQRRPWPSLGVLALYESGFNANYNALSGKLQQRLTKGLTYLVAYTWSKAIDDGGGPRPSGGDPLHVRNEYDLRANRGLSAFDPGRRFVTSLVYELPFGSGKNFGSNRGLLSHLIGGWQIGSIVTFADGLPTDVGTIGDTLNLGSSSGNYPNATGVSPFLANPTQYKFWNVAAFDATSPNLSLKFGNAGRNTLRTPGRQNWDASVARTFKILEGHSLQFRLEAFNLTNHPNWNTPSANAQTPSTFGVITSAKTMRQMQVALKYSF